MTQSAPEARLAALNRLVSRVGGLCKSSSSRTLVGIAGSPGSGKTTLARALVSRLNHAATELAVYVPMDGFHLANSTLDRLQRHDRKGAIDTFDAWGFVALLRRLREETSHTIYAPSFVRSVDEGVTGEIAVEPNHTVVVVEGNYLLSAGEPWGEVVTLTDEVWFVSTPAGVREARLVERHTRHGRTLAAARAWARDVDGANAHVIEETKNRADLIISGLDWGLDP